MASGCGRSGKFSRQITVTNFDDTRRLGSRSVHTASGGDIKAGHELSSGPPRWIKQRIVADGHLPSLTGSVNDRTKSEKEPTNKGHLSLSLTMCHGVT
jgi:hypothetical protein